MSLIDVMKKVNMPDEFIANISNDDLLDDSLDFVQKIYDLAKEEDPSFAPFRALGITQCCIGDFNNQDYVIKIPFTHTVECDEDEPEELYWNYTQKAYDMSKEIAEAGISKFFALVTIEGKTLNGYPIYTQIWVRPACRGCSDLRKTPISESTPAIAKDIYEKYENPFSEEWTEDCIELYGEEKFIDLLKYLSTYQCDMHSGNYGWDKNGLPKILDYSGYEEQY